MPKVSNAAPDAAQAEINYFSTVTDTGRPQQATVADALEAIRSGRFKDKVEAVRAIADKNKRQALKKKTLPCWTFSGTFSYRNEESMTAHSGFAVVDFDHMDPTVWQATRELLVQDPFVYALFTSPSGDGLKVLYRIPADKGAHRAHYAALLQHVSQADPDPANRDPSRCCFVSWDPDLYVNKDAEVFTGKVEATAPLPTDAEQLVQDRATNIAAASPILDCILELVEPVDYSALAGVAKDRSPSMVDYQVHTVRQVLNIARASGFGLCKTEGFVYVYTGTYWQALEPDSIRQLLGFAAHRMGMNETVAESYQFRKRLLEQFLDSGRVPAPPAREGVTLVNCANGTFEVTSSEQRLRPFDPADFITYQLPFDFDPEATAPQFMRYLDRVLPDKALQAIVAEYMGYLFAKGVKHEKLLVLYGSGANGKSVLFDIVTALLGGSANVSNYSLGSLTSDSSTAEYYRAKLANKLVNYASEINARTLGADVTKQLASGEPVSARHPYGQPFTITNYAKLIFNANELPRDIEATHAFHRRLLIVPFDVRIPEAEQDKYLAPRIIQGELSGVFNWCLDGLRRLLANGRFTQSDKVEQVAAEYRRLSDSVRAWIEETGLTPSATDYLTQKDLFQQYRTVCLENGNRPCSQGTFGERLKGAGFTIDKRNVGNIVWATRSSSSAGIENVF
jgi:putative DNA primase/helicase